jgi:hypothetical protein
MAGYAVITKNPRFGTYTIDLCVEGAAFDTWEVDSIFIDNESRSALKPLSSFDEAALQTKEEQNAQNPD